MKHRWIVGLLGLGLGLMAVESTSAQTPQLTYNGLTLEIWSPEKQAWCSQQHPELTQWPVINSELESDLEIAAEMTLAERLQGTTWQLEDLNGTGVLDNVQTTLEFSEDDRIFGTGGCNRYFSDITFEEDGATATNQEVELGVVGSTQMACLDAVMDQELRYFQSLQSAERMELDGPFLLVYSADEEEPMRFTEVGAAAPVPGLW